MPLKRADWWLWEEPVWCVAYGMSCKQHYSICSKWPRTARIRDSSLFCHWSTALSTTQQDASTTCLYCGLALDIWCSWSVVKKTESMICAEVGHFEHLLWCCLPDIPVATHYNRLFLEPPAFGGMQHIFSQMKKLCILQGSAVTFFRSGG